jgi:hypothetical protein
MDLLEYFSKERPNKHWEERGSWVWMKRYCTQHNLELWPGWLDFEQFFKDLGEKPLGRYHLVRIDKSKGYVPGNVRWKHSKLE